MHLDSLINSLLILLLIYYKDSELSNKPYLFHATTPTKKLKNETISHSLPPSLLTPCYALPTLFTETELPY